MQKCPNCHAENEEEAIFCDQCGFQVASKPDQAIKISASDTSLTGPDQPGGAGAAPRSCPICGYFNRSGDAYCTNCGGMLISTPIYEAHSGGEIPEPVRMQCPSCGSENPSGEIYCQICGFELAASAELASVLRGAEIPAEGDQLLVPSSTSQPAHPDQAADEIIAMMPAPGRLYSIATNANLPLPAQEKIIIGRRDPERGIFPDVDLGSSSLAPNGDISSVSRQHARLLVQGSQVFIEDLNSTNSTFLNRQRLQPGQRYLLNSADELRLGGVLLVFYTS